MNIRRLDFTYEISDERLLAYGRLSIMDRLRWLDDVRLFTLMVRQAPAVQRPPLRPVGESEGRIGGG